MTNIKTNPDSHEHWLQLRAKDVTSSEVAALFGLSPYLTEFELWHRKRDGLIVELAENDRLKWGNRLESAIALGIADDMGWEVAPMKHYDTLPDLRMGSSFDFEILSPEAGILEIKNVDALQFKEKWDTSDEINEAPHIELQVQHQLAVSGHRLAYIGALIGGNTVHLIKRERNEKIINAIKKKVAAFWESIDRGEPPEPDFARDAAFISSLYKYAEPGSIYDASHDAEIIDLVERYRLASEEAKLATEKKDEAKAKILMLIKDSEKVLGDTFTISAGMIGPSKVSYERQGYRNFRIFHKKGKK